MLKAEAGRGNRLLGDWTVRPCDAARPPVGLQRMRTDGESPVTNFPVAVTRLFGRRAAVARLRDLLSANRVVTRFTEGFSAPKVHRAKILLEQLG